MVFCLIAIIDVKWPEFQPLAVKVITPLRPSIKYSLFFFFFSFNNKPMTLPFVILSAVGFTFLA